MTSNLEELKTALYEEFDSARRRADNTHSSYNAELAQSAALFMQAAAKTAETIIALETARASDAQPEKATGPRLVQG